MKPTLAQEEKMIGLLRNALVIAGQEMGEEGDHWPVIKSTVHDIMKTWEQVKVERETDAEMKKHLYQQLEIMEQGIRECAPDVQPRVATKVRQLREIYDAYFTELNADAANGNHETPEYLKRAEAIISTLGEENA